MSITIPVHSILRPIMILSLWDFMVISRWYGYTYEEAALAAKERFGNRQFIAVRTFDGLYEQKRPVSDEQKREWLEEAFGSYKKESESQTDGK